MSGRPESVSFEISRGCTPICLHHAHYAVHVSSMITSVMWHFLAPVSPP